MRSGDLLMLILVTVASVVLYLLKCYFHEKTKKLLERSYTREESLHKTLTESVNMLKDCRYRIESLSKERNQWKALFHRLHATCNNEFTQVVVKDKMFHDSGKTVEDLSDEALRRTLPPQITSES